MKQNMSKYTSQDREVWQRLFDRQKSNLKEKGAKAYNTALNEMQDVIFSDNVPDFTKVNDWFRAKTGWQIEVVKGLIPVDEFFELLAQKKFCSSTWLRSLKNLDYLEEPDMFHDVFGHIPLLSNSVFSEFVYEYGKLGKHYKYNEKALLQLQRLYWFTIEFGIIAEEKQTKVYGAGIISSFGETNRIFEGEVEVIPFDVDDVLTRSFRTDVMQNTYFLIQSLDDLYNCLSSVDRKLTKPIKV